jgi:hypothetical protein
MRGLVSSLSSAALWRPVRNCAQTHAVVPACLDEHRSASHNGRWIDQYHLQELVIFILIDPDKQPPVNEVFRVNRITLVRSFHQS